MKSVLNIVAAVLVAAGLVVAVASLLTPGQVILGIDFKLAATLVVGGLILYALARALLLLERVIKELRLMRKAGLDEPPWLRDSTPDPAVQSAARSAAAMAPAMGVAPVTAESAGEVRTATTTTEVDEDHYDQPPEDAETAWLKPAEDQLAAPGQKVEPEDQASPFMGPAEEHVPDQVGVAIEPEASDSGAEYQPEETPEPEPADVALEPEEQSPPESEEAELEPFSEPEPVDAEEEHRGELPKKLRPSRERPGAAEEPMPIVEEFAQAEESEGDAAEEHPELYVVEERVFSGKQTRVLSDGTIEAETAEGWMRFEDFEHLEEYLEAMAEMGR